MIAAVWEAFHAWHHFHDAYPYKRKKERNIFVAISTFISLLAFVSSAYFMHDGKPFVCLFPYDRVVAIIVFCLSLGFIVLITYIEHYRWAKLDDMQFFPTTHTGTDDLYDDPVFNDDHNKL